MQTNLDIHPLRAADPPVSKTHIKWRQEFCNEEAVPLMASASSCQRSPRQSRRHWRWRIARPRGTSGSASRSGRKINAQKIIKNMRQKTQLKI